jgi:hypothetical protein
MTQADSHLAQFAAERALLPAQLGRGADPRHLFPGSRDLWKHPHGAAGVRPLADVGYGGGGVDGGRRGGGEIVPQMFTASVLDPRHGVEGACLS